MHVVSQQTRSSKQLPRLWGVFPKNRKSAHDPALHPHLDEPHPSRPLSLPHRYCSKEHQKEDYPEHKATCRVAAPFVDALIESVADFKPPPSSYAEVQRIIAAATLYAGRHGPQGPLRNNIFSYLSNTVFCRVCFKLREQLLPGSHLVCCPKCLWGWCCQEHWQEFEPQHQPYCAEYATMRRLHALQRQQAGADLFSGPQLPYPMGKVTQLQQNQMLQSWERYRRLRLASVTNDDTWRYGSSALWGRIGAGHSSISTSTCPADCYRTSSCSSTR